MLFFPFLAGCPVTLRVPTTTKNRTATAEGQIMAQVISTFSRLEQSRFEAFRRATFPRDAIAKYVAHCLIEEQHRPISQGNLSRSTILSQTGGGGGGHHHHHREPILAEVVAPGQAEDIALIVSILAKAYAQRLVTAARRYAAVRCATVEETTASMPYTTNHINNNPEKHSTATPTTTSTNVSGTPSSHLEGGYVNNPNAMHSPQSKTRMNPMVVSTSAMAITPEDLMNAYEERKSQGLDPGFFLQPWNQSQQSILLGNNNNNNREMYQSKRLAALHAQEQYEKVYGDGLLVPSEEVVEEEVNINDGEIDERQRINQESSDMMDKIFETP
jgi:hypothetical protein